ncbi:MAG: hypothetical protein MUF42_14165 [Cytophagaceae bacterium]|jgi:hypothetical protein|nr:hypothetical protein [Cytophagaceae bacterium]
MNAVLLSALFILTTVFCVAFLLAASTRRRQTAVLVSLIAAMQAALAISGFYFQTDSLPPRPTLLILPAALVIAVVFSQKKWRTYLLQFDESYLVLLHTLRIPVEICLYYLFLEKKIPALMTFEGRNWDILSGLSAPLVWYLGVKRQVLSSRLKQVWNIVAMLLLANIVINAILSLPGPLQLQAWEQPNVAVLEFPYCWLPSLVVPMVLFSHLILFIKWNRPNENETLNEHQKDRTSR